jgi:D-ribulokinase
MSSVFIGVDVGTTSARAGLFDEAGTLLATARRPIELWREAGDIAEQSTEDIWEACAGAVREALAQADVPPATVKGVGFDATSSVAVLDPAGNPLSVSPSGDPRRNVIVWMDHRAIAQAKRITETGDPVLRHVGGVMSPEMETPKLLWLKENLPATFHAAGHFLDLTDFLTFRATGSTARSVCTVTCKWTYLAHEQGWSRSYFERIGLADLLAGDGERIGREIVAAGTALGGGLTAEAAQAFGLRPGTPVGAGLIDAHAGGVGTIGGQGADGATVEVLDRFAYVMGTSACIMATTAAPCFVPGVWGPYFSAMVPGLWLSEGGQSAMGAAIDHLVTSHPAHAELATTARAAGVAPLDLLERVAIERSGSVGKAAFLARDVHVLPEFLGNRSPFAEPEARAMIGGLDLDDGLEGLQRLYVSALCGIAYGLADVIDAMRAQGIPCRTMVASGGASRSALVRQIMGDATGIPVVLPATDEPVLLGSAMLGAVASGAFPSLRSAMAGMSRLGAATPAAAPELARFHAAKRQVHSMMRKLDHESRSIMESTGRSERR